MKAEHERTRCIHGTFVWKGGFCRGCWDMRCRECGFHGKIIEGRPFIHAYWCSQFVEPSIEPKHALDLCITADFTKIV